MGVTLRGKSVSIPLTFQIIIDQDSLAVANL